MSANTQSGGALKQIDAGLLSVDTRRLARLTAGRSSAARVALRHSQLRRRHPLLAAARYR